MLGGGRRASWYVVAVLEAGFLGEGRGVVSRETGFFADKFWRGNGVMGMWSDRGE